MTRYQLTQDAKADLRRIYLRGLREFGEAKADIYFFGLTKHFEDIGNAPLRYPSVDDIRLGYRRSLFGNESIFYRIDGEIVEIIAILGRQDHEGWL